MSLKQIDFQKVILAVCVLAGVFFSGCAPIVKKAPPQDVTSAGDLSSYPVTVETLSSKGDMEEETFQKPPERIVAVWQNSIETLLALGAGDRIVAGMGVPNREYIRPEYRDMYDRIPYTSLENLDVESVMMMNPDLIVGWYSTFSAKVLRGTDFWHERGVGTYISPASFRNTPHKTVELEYEDIQNLGKITGHTKEADALVADMEREIAQVTEKARAAHLHRRGFIIELQGKAMTVYGEKTLAGDILTHVGGEILAPGAGQISIEQLIEMDPDAIFVVVIESAYGHEEDILGRLYSNEALRTLRAVRDRRIYAVPLYAVYSSGVRTLDGIQIMAKGLYPELYDSP